MGVEYNIPMSPIAVHAIVSISQGGKGPVQLEGFGEGQCETCGECCRLFGEVG